MWSRHRVFVLAIVLAVVLAGCNREVEDFDPSEQPSTPDLSKIFPQGAERAARIEPGLPEAPGSSGGRGAPPLAVAQGQTGGAANAETGPPIEGSVRLDAGLEAAVPAGSVLFIIARRGGGGPPLAVKRIANPRFPLDFSLGPDDRMIAAMPFTGPLELSARVDSDGNAMSRTPGDLQGAVAAPVNPGERGIDLVISEVL